MSSSSGGPGTPGVYSELAPWVLAGVLAAGAVALSVIWLGGTLGAAAAGAGWRPPPFSAATLLRTLTGGTARVWPGAPVAAVWSGIVATAMVATGAGAPLAMAIRRRWHTTPGLAGLRDLHALTPKGAAKRARGLRPSLAGVANPHPDETGMLLGEHENVEIRSSFEDVEVAFMAPRSGKTTAIAVPRALRAPGPVLITSRKVDVYLVTAAPRRARGKLWVFDPQQIAYAPQDWWWDILAEARTVEGARRLAGHFISASLSAQDRGNFWSLAAGNTLTALFHAAASSGGTVNEVLKWLGNPADRTPTNLLHQAGADSLADHLQRTIRGAPETRDGIYETAGQCAACLLDPTITTWVLPDPDKKAFDPHTFVASTDTLYLFSKKGAGSAAPLVAALTDAALQAAIVRAERAGGRNDPPVLPILDEAANICPIEDLPDLYSYLGSLGVPVTTILQSYRQGVRVWGEPGMDSLWSAATVKILGAGLDDADFADRISRLIGDHKVIEASVSHSSSGHSTSLSPRTERIYQAADVRALPKGTALLLLTGIRPVVIRLRPWMGEPYATKLAAAAKRAQIQLTQRANTKGRSS
ncbi:TraM recognition domain-containing protein (plasmid) [Streptosporangium sp. NBC_01495]|uniref:type IV secretory system conjugative DNA transfer family protein n=1 Tax=Streptosporangium sp. NBC_01495 TaxID=2903899 RepID=UPI002E3609A7|nr:TraM recognition domain-containing protein [Streptosporangium sp. NBC_01495]